MAELPDHDDLTIFLEELISQLTPGRLHELWGLLAHRIVVLVGSEVQHCPFVGMLLLMLLYKSLS